MAVYLTCIRHLRYKGSYSGRVGKVSSHTQVPTTAHPLRLCHYPSCDTVDCVFAMSGTCKLPLDTLYEVSKYLPLREQLDLSCVRRDVCSMISPFHLLRRALLDLPLRDAAKPLMHAIRTDNVSMLSTIDSIIRTAETPRNWNLLLTYTEHYCIESSFPLEEALRYSSKCFEFLLDIILLGNTDVFSLQKQHGLVVIPPGDQPIRSIYMAELLATAIWHDHVDCVGMILDRLQLFDLCGYPFNWEDFMTNPRNVLRQIPSVRMAKCLISRGWRPPSNALHEICTDYRLYKENRADLLSVMVSNGVDINGMEGTTPLIAACDEVNVPAIEALLKLGADPNATAPSRFSLGVLCVKARGDSLLNKQGFMRPIDALLKDAKKWKGKPWQAIARAMYKSIKLLVEHGAAMSTLPDDQKSESPVYILLRRVWRLICPTLRHAAGVDEREHVTFDQLLEELSTVDIQPLDKLCDIVLDSSSEYSDISKGLRGKERLARILPHIENLQVKYKWTNIDRRCFSSDFYGNKLRWDSDNDDYEGFDDTCLYDSDLDYYKPAMYTPYEGITAHLSFHNRPHPRRFLVSVNYTIRNLFPDIWNATGMESPHFH